MWKAASPGTLGQPSGNDLALPIDLHEAFSEESRVNGDLARTVLLALSHVPE